MDWYEISENKLILDLINQQEISDEQAELMQEDKFLLSLEQHKVLSYAYKNFIKDKTLLKDAYLRQQAQNALLLSELKNITSIFNENNIEFIAIKGVSLIDDIYQSDERDIQDIDLLIQVNNLKQAEELLIKSNYQPEYVLDNYAEKLDLYLNHAKEFKSIQFATSLDLHWKLAEEFIISNEFTRQFWQANNENIDPNWQFLCLSVQAYKNNWQEIQGLLDLSLLAKHKNLRISEIRKLADLYNLSRIVETTVSIAEKYLNLDSSCSDQALNRYTKLQEKSLATVEAYKYFVFSDNLFLALKRLFYRFCLPFGKDLNISSGNLGSLTCCLVKKNIQLFLKLFNHLAVKKSS